MGLEIMPSVGVSEKWSAGFDCASGDWNSENPGPLLPINLSREPLVDTGWQASEHGRTCVAVTLFQAHHKIRVTAK